MALQRQTIELPFSGGVDQKAGRPHRPSTRLSSVANGYQEKSGELRQAPTFTVKSSSIYQGSSLGAATDLQAYQDALVVRNNPNVYVRSGEKWSSVGAQWAFRTRTRSIAHDRSFSSEQMDVARGGGFRAFIYRINTAIYADIVDDTTGVTLIARQPIATGMSTSNAMPRVIATSTEFIFLWVVSNTPNSTLNAQKVSFSTPTTFSGTTAVATNLVNNAVDVPRFDVMAGPSVGTLYIATYTATNTFQMRIFTTSSMTTTTGPTSYTLSTGTALLASLEIAVWDYSDSRVYVVAASDNDTRIEAFKINSTTLALDTSGTVASGISPRNTASYYSVVDTTLNVFSERDVTIAGSATVQVDFRTLVFGGGTSATALHYRAGLASKVWKRPGTAQFFVLVVYDAINTTQNTYFLVTSTPLDIAARFLYKNAGDILTGGLPHAVSNADNGLLTAGQKAIELDAPGGGITITEFGVATIEATPSTPLNMGDWATAADIGIEPGGIVRTFDGYALPELNFNLHPEQPGQTVQAAGGNLTLLGTYNYRIVYAWMDRNQRLHRSEPSPELATPILLTGANNRITLTLHTLTFTNKSADPAFGNLPEVDIEIYRTTDAGQTYYKTGSVANSVGTATVSFVDNLADDSLTDNELLYAQEGVIVNRAPPALLAVTFWNNRFWGISAENPREIWYSKLLEPGLGIAFNATFLVEADEEFVGLSGLDDKLLAVTSDSVYVLTGDGPDNLGNGVYSPPFKLAHKVGLVYPRALASCELGLILRTQRGIELIDRGLGLAYIGAAVEDQTDAIVDAQVIPAHEQVRLVTNTGKILVWDWHHQQWYVWSGLAVAVAATAINGLTYFITPGGVLLKDDNAVVSPSLSMVFRTAWIRLSGIQAFERVYFLMLLGEFFARHTISVNLYYDYDDTVAETHAIDTYDLLPPLTANAPEQVLIAPQRQKCQAISVEATVQSVGGETESVRWWALSIEAGMKAGLDRRARNEILYNRGL